MTSFLFNQKEIQTGKKGTIESAVGISISALPYRPSPTVFPPPLSPLLKPFMQLVNSVLKAWIDGRSLRTCREAML